MRLLSVEDFEPWVGKAVRVATDPEPVEVTLVRAERLKQYTNEFREPFVLYFESPESVYLLDDTYDFDCGRGGPYRFYISQLLPRPGMPRRYQAAFG